LTGSGGNLHSLWDGAVGTSNAMPSIITAASKLAPAPSSRVNDQDVSHWTRESSDLAQKEAYKKPTIGDGTGPFTADAAYKANVTKIAQARIALAGARLAKMLNEQLK